MLRRYAHFEFMLSSKDVPPIVAVLVRLKTPLDLISLRREVFIPFLDLLYDALLFVTTAARELPSDGAHANAIPCGQSIQCRVRRRGCSEECDHSTTFQRGHPIDHHRPQQQGFRQTVIRKHDLVVDRRQNESM